MDNDSLMLFGICVFVIMLFIAICFAYCKKRSAEDINVQVERGDLQQMQTDVTFDQIRRQQQTRRFNQLQPEQSLSFHQPNEVQNVTTVNQVYSLDVSMFDHPPSYESIILESKQQRKEGF